MIAALRIALASLLLGAAPALAGGQPGDFDYYVLSLSWSPSYCEAEGDARGSAECGTERPYAFLVHGLWPQYEKGFPADCDSGVRGPSSAVVEAMSDLMPDPGLIRHEWRKHGTCSGLDAVAYFKTVRSARAAVTIPARFSALTSYLTVNPGAVEQAFLAANPGLPRDGIAVTCDGRRLREVRICMTSDLEFRDCAEVDRRGCRSSNVVMPPVR